MSESSEAEGSESSDEEIDDESGVIDVDTLEVCTADDENEEQPLEEGTTRLLDPGVEGWDRPSRSIKQKRLRTFRPLF